LRADADFDSVRALARDMAAVLAERHRATLTVEQRNNKRRGRVYLDVMRNAYGQTSVIPYSVRALSGAPVATPLDLAELGDRRLDPQRWHLKNILRRLSQKHDPRADIARHATTAGRAHRALREIRDN
jgi:bifunctional non-homologous end joining protein LigD